ncbi:MAG TPA: FeoA family protein [Phycisphaerae bacterium]|nr:FeoA family protein [Phycisphaerae bacterium]HUT57721.1 FeoA family protein [Phycisphaerae bacterium]
MASQTDRSTSRPRMPLAMALVGQTVRFISARGGRGLSHRLAEMGLTPGETLEVLNRGPGPFIVNVRGTRLILGHGMVGRIFVQPT